MVLGALTELFLIYVARWWAPSPVTYFLAVLFLPVMVLTGFWSFKYFKLVQQNLELSRRACVPVGWTLLGTGTIDEEGNVGPIGGR